ncbi:phage tail assembly chaperone [Leminorella grimontii]|uniref:phage tail assembly chaperone n=1 Tax=Leminorella grimontii TaxID=82981 RepID=UPI00322001CA
MEFEINGVDYRAAKLSVFDQLKVSRKLLPVLAGLASEFNAISTFRSGGDPYASLAVVLPKIAEALAEMSDENVNAVLHPCLAVVSRKHEKSFVPVFTQGELMFDDIDLLSMLQIVGRVVGDSLGNFLRALPEPEIATPSAD